MSYLSNQLLFASERKLYLEINGICQCGPEEAEQQSP